MATDRLQSFVDGVEVALKTQGIATRRSVDLGNDAVANVVGFRCRFAWAGVVLIDECVALRSVPAATSEDLRDLFSDTFSYARSRNRVPLPRGAQFGYFIVPCVVTNQADSELREAAISRPPKHWAVHEAPVVVDVGSRTAYYYNGNALWGTFYFPYVQRLIQRAICDPLKSA